MAAKIPTTLIGKKLRFTFKDGPMAGNSFDHTFNKDGTVDFGPPDGKTTKSKHAAIEKVAAGFFLASYLGPKGYTLTVGIDAAGGKIVAFSSDGKEWSQQKGTFELVEE